MKILLIKFLTVFSTLLFITTECNHAQKQNNYSEAMITEMLRDFYTSYISLYSIGTFLPEEIEVRKGDSIKNKYCTKKLLYSLHELFASRKIDYDPFLEVQMIDREMLKSLAIKKDTLKNNIYHVSFTYSKPHLIRLFILKENGLYKIDSLPDLQKYVPESIKNR